MNQYIDPDFPTADDRFIAVVDAYVGATGECFPLALIRGASEEAVAACVASGTLESE